MSPSRSSPAVVPLAVLLVLWGVAFAMAARLTFEPLNVDPHSRDTSVAERLLGVSRVAFGESFYEEADDYFHKGVGHIRAQAFSNTFFQALATEIEPNGHVHTHGPEVREIMPWLRFTTEMDPHNVEAYLTTAYWLTESVGRPDVAQSVLLEGQRNNPNDYRVINERAQMLFGTQDDQKARRLLDTAIRLWPSGQNSQDEGTRLDLAQMLSYRAFLYELEGNSPRALEMFRKAHEIMPSNTAIAQRIRALERGRNFSVKDRQVWEQVFARHHVCARDEHAGEDHGPGEDD